MAPTAAFDSVMITQRVFVVGYMHSGTTLVLQLLRRHGAFFSSGGETKFFDSLPMLQRKFPDLTDDQTLRDFITFTADMIHRGASIGGRQNQHGISIREQYPHRDVLVEQLWSEVATIRDYVTIFCAVFDAMARLASRSRWLEKTPGHVYHIDQIISRFRDVRIVEIVRDPRDILASKQKRLHDVWHSERYSPERRKIKSLEKAFDPLWDTLAWKSAVRATSRAHMSHPEQIFRIRYEDLVSEPERHMKHLCTFLDIVYAPEMLDVKYRISADLSHTGHHHGISSYAVGRWRQGLSQRHLALAQVVARSELDELGYEPALVSTSAYASFPILFMRSYLDLLRRLYHKLRLAGISYLWSVVLDYAARLREL